MSTKKGSVTVSLAGQKFSIKSDHPEQHLQQLAAYVDRKVRELQRLSTTVGTQQLALLAAMNIADELFSAEARQREFKGRVVRKSETLLRAVENAMQSRAHMVRESTVPTRTKEAKA
jgi:cell division protein ZapA